MRNSYLVTLILIFWISLFTANLIHIGLLLFTIAFMVKQDKKQGSSTTVSFRNKYWIYLVIYLNVVIFCKYLYGLQLYEFSSYTEDIIELFGLQYDYQLFENDFSSLTLLWLLNIFVVL